jgi:UPF0755 protein
MFLSRKDKQGLPENYFFDNYRTRFQGRQIIFGFCLLIILMLGYFFSIRPPASFPHNSLITIKEGSGLNQVASLLSRQHIIRSPIVFRGLVTVFGGEHGVLAGDYFFESSESVLTVVSRLTGGRFGLPLVKVTIPEGTSVNEMVSILKESLTSFDSKEFLKIAKGREGYLFPDTYHFLINAKAPEVKDAMEKNFQEKISSIQKEITAFGKSLSDVVTMASILEEEARTTETRRVISGILWKRLAEGMPLQVDAVFPYIIGKNTYQITLDDLQVDSPYNTYKYAGLPPGAITNPGLDSLRTAVTPITSPYYFYLSDKNGDMHYAKTFAEHVVNKNKYLK